MWKHAVGHLSTLDDRIPIAGTKSRSKFTVLLATLLKALWALSGEAHRWHLQAHVRCRTHTPKSVYYVIPNFYLSAHLRGGTVRFWAGLRPESRHLRACMMKCLTPERLDTVRMKAHSSPYESTSSTPAAQAPDASAHMPWHWISRRSGPSHGGAWECPKQGMQGGGARRVTWHSATGPCTSSAPCL